MRILTAILLIGFFCEGLQAQIITDRPDQTESSSTVPKGSLQIESGVLISYEGENEASTRQLLLPTNLFRLGIKDWIELRVVSQFELLDTGEKKIEGISDLEIGTKIQLMKGETVNTEMAFLSHLILPTGTDDLSGNRFGTSNRLSISHELTESTGIAYNLGYNYFGEQNGDFTYSLALGIKINDKAGVYVEPYGEIANMKKFIANFDTGVTYLATDDLQFDFSFGTGINQTMNYIAVGASWLIERQ